MGLFARLEQGLSNCLEGVSSRLFGGRLSSREVAKVVEDHVASARLDDGRDVACNHYLARLNEDDLDRLAAQLAQVRREAAERVRRAAEARGLPLAGRPQVRFEPDPAVPVGRVEVTAAVVPGPGAAELRAQADGHCYPLLDRAVVLGREPACDVVLAAAGVSRRHCRIEPRGDHWQVTDLGSTNTTQVNGGPVSTQPLRHGSVLTVGQVRLEFRELDSG